MSLELTAETIDAVIFCMENQNETFLFDTETFRCVPVSASAPPSERFIQLPPWTAVHGFALMEEFTGSVKNPLLQERLRRAISTRLGVFKRFKEILAEYPEFDRAWHVFKKERLKKTVIEWFRSFTQAESLSTLGEEPEETAEIVQSDFLFLQKKLQGDLQLALETLARGGSAEEACARAGIEPSSPEEILVQGAVEILKALPEKTAGASARLFARLLSGDGEKILFYAETASGEKAGSLLVERFTGSRTSADVLIAAAVKPEFRGMGLFTQLLEKAMLSAESGERAFICAMPIPNQFLLHALERTGVAFCFAYSG